VTTGGAGRPTVKLTDFGGKADGVTDNLPAFKKAFAKLASTSGGTLVVPRLTPVNSQPSDSSDGSSGSGGAETVYKTLPLLITQSNLTLIIEEGVRLKAKTDTVLSHAGAESEGPVLSSSFSCVCPEPVLANHDSAHDQHSNKPSGFLLQATGRRWPRGLMESTAPHCSMLLSSTQLMPQT
jgi:hypothetical protein